jgi:hypothetical protein
MNRTGQAAAAEGGMLCATAEEEKKIELHATATVNRELVYLIFCEMGKPGLQ